MEKNPTLVAFGLNLESNGGNNHFMVRHVVDGAGCQVQRSETDYLRGQSPSYDQV